MKKTLVVVLIVFLFSTSVFAMPIPSRPAPYDGDQEAVHSGGANETETSGGSAWWYVLAGFVGAWAGYELAEGGGDQDTGSHQD